MRSSFCVVCLAAALLMQGCVPSTKPLKKGKQQVGQGQLCRWELGRCETIFPADLLHAEPLGLATGDPGHQP
ncbi:MAG: hypothetical protein Q7U99_12405 [Rubrivivax sp.]|nr:hypothetical protein [Rubrivivax sp.]